MLKTVYFDVSRGKLNGIFSYLYKKYSANYEDYVKVNGTGADFNNVNRNPIGTVIPNSGFYFVGHDNDYNVYLLKHYVHIVHYSIKQNTGSIRLLSQWKLQGSIDEGEWETLNEVNDCDENCKNESVHSYPSKEGIFNAFRVLKINENADKTDYYDIFKFELFGSVCLTKDCKVPIRMFHTKCSNQNNHGLLSLFIMIIMYK